VFANSDGALPASGRIEIADARLAIGDGLVTPPQMLEFANADILLSAEPGRDSLAISLGGRLSEAGDVVLLARIPADTAAEQTLSLEATDLPAAMLSRYATETVGRGLSAGRADFHLAYTRSAEGVNGDIRLVARGLALAAPESGSEATDANTNGRLDLAVALLADADGVIDLNLPFAGNARSVRFAAADAIRARIATLTATPFDAIAPLIAGDVDAVRAVAFVPGNASLGDRALAVIDQLAAVLIARPQLGLRVHGGFALNADRNELARQQIQLHVLLATAGPSAQARPRPIDFSSARAQDVLDEFGGERLPAERVEEIAAVFECEGAIALLCRRAYYTALFDALVANEEITDGALNRLGRFRAQSVVEALTQRGISAARIEVASGAEVIDSPFGIGLPVEFTVAARP
jgi:hypothetical protein